MDSEIDIEKSIQAERFVYIGTFGQKLWTYFFDYVSGIITISIFYFLFLNTINKDYPFVTMCVLCSLTLLVFISAIFLDKLNVVKQSNQNVTVATLTKKLQSKYPKIKFDQSKNGILIGEVHSKFWRFDRIITVLFNDDYLAINISTGDFHRGSMKYSLTAIWNFYKSKAILKSL